MLITPSELILFGTPDNDSNLAERNSGSGVKKTVDIDTSDGNHRKC